MSAEYITRSAYANRHTGAKRMYATQEEKKVILKKPGTDAAVLLYEFYLSKAADTRYKHTDTKTARAFGWPVSKAKRTRLLLEKLGWYKRNSYHGGKGVSGEIYDVGEIQVLERRLASAVPQATIQDVVDGLNNLMVKHDANMKIAHFRRWVNDGIIDMLPAEIKAFKDKPYEFIEQVAGWVWVSRR